MLKSLKIPAKLIHLSNSWIQATKKTQEEVDKSKIWSKQILI